MARGIYFSPRAWDEFMECQDEIGTYRRLTILLNECRRDPFKGTGKPERLKHQGVEKYWSRRITDKHRLVYGVTETHILVARCRGHYDDK